MSCGSWHKTEDENSETHRISIKHSFSIVLKQFSSQILWRSMALDVIIQISQLF